MLTYSEILIQAHVTAAQHTVCSNCQPAIVAYLTENPLAPHNAIVDYHESVWENCQDCQAEYAEYLQNCDCVWHAGHHAEDCSKCLDEWADANAPEYDECNPALAEELNANPFRFNGGEA